MSRTRFDLQPSRFAITLDRMLTWSLFVTRDHQVGILDVGLDQQPLIERAAMQHNGPAQLVGDGDRALACSPR